MAYKYKKKKRTYKKKKYGKRKATIGRSLGFPRERTVTLRYVDAFDLTPGPAAVQYHFRANSLFDPNYTSTGHQPFCFDQWTVYYNHYQVQSARMKVTAQLNGAMGYPVSIGSYLADDATTSYDWSTFRESGRGTFRQLPVVVSDRTFTLSQSFNLKKFFNRTADPGATSASVSANPTEDAFFVVWAMVMNTINTASSAITFTVQIDYTARFFEPKDLPSS